MKASPAANEFFEFAMRTGNSPASIAIAAPTAICSRSAAGSAATVRSACARTAAPSSTITHQ